MEQSLLQLSDRHSLCLSRPTSFPSIFTRPAFKNLSRSNHIPFNCSFGGQRTANQRNRGTVTEKVVKAPLLEALSNAADTEDAPFFFPGHKRGAAAPVDLEARLGPKVFEHDLPELPELDNLFAPEGPILEAQALAAEAFGADKTWFLVNGSTCGVQAAVMATCRQGDYLVLPRNCHQAAISALVLSGALPAYMAPAYSAAWELALGVTVDTVEKTIKEVLSEGGRLGAVLIVSPTYNGICSNIAAIGEVCKKFNVPLLVDEAHGGHFSFYPDLPPPALVAGADLVIQSTHKVLSSFTQSAMLHIKGQRIDHQRISAALQVLQSSSPSYLLLSSLDAARAQMEHSGEVLLGKALQLASKARGGLQGVAGVVVLDRENLGGVPSGAVAAIDPLRITVNVSDLGITGYEADDLIREEFHVTAELPTLSSLTFAISAGTTERHVAALVTALSALSRRLWTPDRVTGRRSPALEKFPEGKLSPREAFFAETEEVPADEAVGRVSAKMLCPYPPGIPVFIPGEVVSVEGLNYLRTILQAGGSVSGASDADLQFLSVVAEGGRGLLGVPKR